MSLRRIVHGNPEGKTAWEHVKGWFSGDDERQKPQHPLKGRFNPLNIDLGQMVELSTPKAKAYEVDGVLCFEPIGAGERATRYELKGTRPPSVLELLDQGETGAELYTLYELADEFELDEELIEVCRNDDDLKHFRDEGDGAGEVETRYLKDAISRSRALIHDEEGSSRAEVEGFYYSSESGDRFLTVEVWRAERWMRFYVGRELRSAQVMSLGTGLKS
jgi:hypothetical protein